MIYLDNAATSLKRPQSVIDAVNRAMTECASPGRGISDASLEAARRIQGARRSVAALLGAEPNRIAFVSNGTEALNIALGGLFSPGDRIISTVTEHNSVLRPLRLLADAGIGVDFIRTDENGVLDYDSVQGLITPATRAFVINCVSNVTGNIADLEFFKALREKYGLLLIADGSQSIGHINTDVSGIDIFCFTGHKGLMAPQGTGGLYAAPGICPRPLKVGGTGFKSYDQYHPTAMPDALEAGTPNTPGIAGLGAAADYINADAEAIMRRERELARRFYNRVKDAVTVYGDFSTERRAPIVSININDEDPMRICIRLWDEYRIAVRGGVHCAPLMHRALGTDKLGGTVRFSFGCFNTDEEVETAAAAVRRIAEECSAGKT